MSPCLVCNVCAHEWCGTCKIPWHSGKSCDEVERARGEVIAEKGMAKFRKKNRVMTCPSCNMGITKIDGCNRVQYGPLSSYIEAFHRGEGGKKKKKNLLSLHKGPLGRLFVQPDEWSF
jgi:protein-arginine kinase activator protein McsA